MKNKLLLLGISALISVNVLAQGSWQWTDLITGVDDDVSREMVLDADNNLYVFAQIEGTVNVGGDVFTSFGNFDALLIKFDQSGDYQWGLQLGGTDQETPTDIAVDAQNNVYVTGGFKGTAEFNPASPGGSGQLVNSNPDALNKNDIFLAKYTSAGAFVWAYLVSTGAHNEFARNIDVDATGDIIMVGDFKTEITFNTSQTVTATGSNQDIFVAKIDQTASPTTEWYKHFPTTNDNGKFLSVDATVDGDIYIGGYFTEKLYFETDSCVSAGSTDIVILKLESDGDVVWVRQGGGSGLDQINTISADFNENVFFTGYFSSTANLDVSAKGEYDSDPITSEGGYDILFGKYDNLGNLEFVYGLGDTGNDNGYGLALYENFVEFTGYFAGTIIFNNDTIMSSGTSNNDVGIFRYDREGNPLKAHDINGVTDDRGLSLVIDNLGNSYIAGYFQSDTLLFDPEFLINATDDQPTKTKDVFIAKYNPSIEAEFTEIQMVSCFGYADGQLSVTPYFGTPPFTFTWDHDAGLMDQVATNLAAGMYEVIVSDSQGEKDTVDIEITEPDQVITGAITGATEVDESATETYDVTGKLNSTFAWIVTGGTLLSGQGNDTISIQWGLTGTGNVSVVETDENGCMGDPVDQDVDIGTSKINDVNVEKIKVYPNPFNSRATIEFYNPDNELYTLTVTDLTGKIVKEITGIKDSRVELTRDNLSGGYYIIELKGKYNYRSEILIK